MISAIADTHAVIWYLFASPTISTSAKEAIDLAHSRGMNIGISAISLAEIVYLTEKQRLSENVLPRLMATLENVESAFIEVPVDGLIVKTLAKISRDEVPDLPDRIIAATAVYYDVPLITRDARIRATSVHTIW